MEECVRMMQQSLSSSSYDEKTSEERVFSTESWYNQGAEEGKAEGEGGLERRDDYADFTDEVRLSLRWAGLY